MFYTVVGKWCIDVQQHDSLGVDNLRIGKKKIALKLESYLVW